MWPVECHEVWEYDDKAHIQKLIRLIAICPSCHQVKHIGRTASVDGVVGMERCVRHLMKVNGWSMSATETYIEGAYSLHAKRSRHQWELDLSWLSTYGITPPEP